MRGTPIDAEQAFAYPGIIPAYAGNTESWCMWFRPAGDHPRVCGEHGTKCWKPRTPPGSSPRMRGTRESGMADYIAERIIPAYAGNTWWRTACPCCIWDHPRVCGEHTCSALAVPVARGSSPRMRGTPSGTAAVLNLEWIIPAYAGNTCPAIRKHSPTRDHPRVCGEHALSTVLSTSSAGSSPRMRGTPTCADYEIPWRGIIPAYAGNTHVRRL